MVRTAFEYLLHHGPMILSNIASKIEAVISSRRIENYATSVFEKRLDLYEELFRRISQYSEVATEIIENDKLTRDQRHDFVSVALHEVAGFCDEHELYLNEELTLHCCAILVGVEDIHYIKEIRMKET